MPRDLILGTAGHIDHGKTALVKALTGVDCDRLPEEKARGITIDIGFAALDLGEFQLGVVDVPGHERFVRNMLAGASGIDLALLVVAADDGVMPQTREHFEILKLLGCRFGVIALTKCDLADDTALDVVELEVRDLVAGSFLEHAPLVRTSTLAGVGIAELTSALRRQCGQFAEQQLSAVDSHCPFRMAIDRSFVMQGHGAVVTGSVSSGQLSVGDEVEWLPSQRRLRVRGLHQHDQPVTSVHRGMRAAVNLAGIDHHAIHRGQELATPGHLSPARTLSVQLRVSADVRKPLKHRTPIRLHIGAGEVMGTLALLNDDAIAPGNSGPAQLFLDEPVVATWNQPFVIRDSAAMGTLGGGIVLQPAARKLRRRDESALSQLARLLPESPPAARGESAAWARGTAGIDETSLTRDAGIEPDAIAGVVAELIRSRAMIELASNGGRRFLHADIVADLEKRLLAALAKMQAAHPLATDHARSQLIDQLDYVNDPGLIQAIVDRLLATNQLVGDAKRVARADAKPKLTANQRKLKDTIVAAHLAAGFQPPDPASFAGQAGGNQAAVRELLAVAESERLLFRISDALFLHAEVEATLRQRVRKRLESQPDGLTVAEIRDLLGTTRKFAVPLCEYLDRVKVTCRAGDLRRLAVQDRPPTGE